jgi:hypothetical protein
MEQIFDFVRRHPSGEERANDRTDARANEEIDRDVVLAEHGKDTRVRESLGGASAQRQAHLYSSNLPRQPVYAGAEPFVVRTRWDWPA